MIVGFVASAVAGAVVYATVVGDPPPEVAPIELREPRGTRTEGPREPPKSRKKEGGRKPVGPAPTQPTDDDGTSGPAPVQPVPAPAGGGDDDDGDDDDEPNTDD